jgi:endonuclease G
MYRLTDRMTHGTNVRMSYFKKDAMLYGEPASYDDYVGSGYDRGHLVPADDMVFNTQAIEETYYMSNVAPQTPNLNRGLWKKIENYIRHRIIADHSYYIIAGPLLNDQLPKIPNTDISVPFYYYKIVLDIEFPEFKAIAFLVPNRKVSGALHQFVVSIDYLERMTGMDFFPLIESCLQEKLESEINLEQWELK